MNREEPKERPADDGTGASAEAGALPPEAATFLKAFSDALQRYSLYPADHPAVEPVAEGLREKLSDVLAGGRGVLSLAVSPDGLHLAGAEPAADGPRFGTLARRLHEHDIARLTFRRGITADQLHGLLTEVSRVPEAEEERFGRRAGSGTGWRHLGIEPVRYDTLALGSDESREEAGAEVSDQDRTARLWLGMAKAVGLQVEDAEDGEGGRETPPVDAFTPAEVARALEEQVGEGADAVSMAGQLQRILEELAASGEEGLPDLRERFSELLSELHSDTLQEVLREGASGEERREFLLTSAAWLPVGEVVKLVEGAAREGDLDVSRWMLRMFGKMGRHAESAGGDRGRRAEREVRQMAHQAFTEWTLDHRSLEEYSEAGGDGVGPGGRSDLGLAAGAMAGGREADVDPERVLQTALEAGTLGASGEAAFEALIEQGRTVDVLELLEDAPPASGPAEELWGRLATRESLERLLAADPPELEAAGKLAARMGADASPPLLDRLETAESRSVRRNLFGVIAGLGREILPEVVDRLDDDRWYVRRNMLALLHDLGGAPEGFSPAPLADDPKLAVRVEAYKLMLEDPDHRREGVLRALEEDEARPVALAISAVEPPLDDELRDGLLRLLEREDLSADVKAQAVRALAAAPDARTCEALADLCRAEQPWWKFWASDAVRDGPVALEALRGLAAGCADRAEGRRVLELAAASDDPEVREAASGAGEGGT